ncbi:MAG: 1-hydroxycarotenoid 3,4-desaturase CrtD [Roseovarius sp.]
MNTLTSTQVSPPRAVVIGAGIAGLAMAARLAHAGHRVTVLERHGWTGGKMRTLPSQAGPVDTGPTVLTMRHVFERLFHDLGEQLEDHVTLIHQPMIARHFWPDGSQLDLYDDEARNIDEITAFAGAKAAQQFVRFCGHSRTLFDGLEDAMMQATAPSLPAIATHVLRHPHLIPKLATTMSMARFLSRQFSDPRLAQLFGRYATYVGGSPYRSPALLSLIWQAEMAGVYAVKGGMHRLAQAITDLAQARGAVFQYNAHVAEVLVSEGEATGVRLADGTVHEADTVVFNGDPRAMATGALGVECTSVAPQTVTIPRSLSAEVWAFAATPSGRDLAYHNVFFRTDPKPEFEALHAGRRIGDPTIYLCAQDRAGPDAPPTIERFETIANAPPLTDTPVPQEVPSCQTRTFQTLQGFGLSFSPTPDQACLTTPKTWDTLFPATAGSIYGQSPHGMMAAFQRPTARTAIKGLYLVGGGAHPGAGVPMATLSAQHAAETMQHDQISTSRSRQADMPGGMSMASS